MPKPYQPNDPLARKAKQQGYRARSVYKLEELDKRYYLVRKNMRVLDVGAYPGSWLQYIAQIVGPQGSVLGIDLKNIDFINDNVKTVVGDINDLESMKETISEMGYSQFDLIVADMAPSTTGIRYHDQAESLELNQALLELTKIYLKKDGKLVSKIFQSELVHPFLKELRLYFNRAELTTVSGSRDRSTEMYIIATGKL